MFPQLPLMTCDIIVDFQGRTKWQGTDQARAQPISTTAIITYVKRIKTVLAWLEREKIIKDNVLAAVRPPKSSRRLPRSFDEDVIKKVLKCVIDEPRELVFILFILDTGITLQEITDLDDRDMNIPRLEARVFRQKTKKERILHFSPATGAALAAYRAVRPPAVAEPRFFLNWDGEPMTKHRVQAILARVGKRAGIGARLSPHRLRHTFATMSLRNGATLEHDLPPLDRSSSNVRL
jgi:site-specific recombinase XerD